MSKAGEPINIAIIGAGVGGITAAIYLQEKLGFYNYTVYEKATEVGGTWRQNNYPGCACDVPAHWYSLSIDPNPNWKTLYAPREEIKQYWKQLSAKHKVEPRIEYGSELVSAVWSEEKQHYTLRIRDVKTQVIREVTAQVVISAIGVFHVARWPDIPGRELFQGDLLHAQNWDHSVSLSGKRVALVGNGCAGAQILPVISEDSSTHVVNFCRTPSWFLPRAQVYMSERMRWIFRNIPFALKLVRWSIATFSEVAYRNMTTGLLGRLVRRKVENIAINYIKQTAPAKYHDQLIPKYPLGCKRVIADPGYIPTLNRPNVDLEWDPIVEIVSNGIRTKSGKTHEFDVIAFATGFDIESSFTLDVTGVNGQTLQEYYDREGGPTGYMGTTAPGFPNWITIFGPNTTTGHASVIFAEELQMNYSIQLLKPLLQGKIKSFVPRAEPTRKWNDWVQSQLLGKHIWSSCASWYRAGGQQGKIVALWPGSSAHMWWSFRKPIFGDFEFNGGKGWLRRKQLIDASGKVFWFGALMAGLVAVTA